MMKCDHFRKAGNLLDVSEGDDIYLEVSSLNYKPVKVMHIAENYYYHYVYMTPECYQSLFGKDIEYDEIFVVNKDPEDISYENDFSAKYLDNNCSVRNHIYAYNIRTG